jgi:hypothetical protein
LCLIVKAAHISTDYNSKGKTTAKYARLQGNFYNVKNLKNENKIKAG